LTKPVGRPIAANLIRSYRDVIANLYTAEAAKPARSASISSAMPQPLRTVLHFPACKSLGDLFVDRSA
jgi:hypothetical protein